MAEACFRPYEAGAISFRKPGRSKLTAHLGYTDEDLIAIREAVAREGRYQFDKSVDWLDKGGNVISTITKTVYVASKEHYKKRQAEKAANNKASK